MKLKKLEVKAYAGINPASPVVIDFSESNFVKASGDNGAGKTSLLNALLTACGQLSKDDKNKINRESGKIDIDMDFVGNDRLTYHVRCTKSVFQLTYAGEAVPEPITKMKELLGVVGVSPMVIKDAKLTDIIKWLASYSNKNAEEFEKKILKFKDSIKEAETSRADANRSLKGLNEYLSNEQMYNDWEETEKKFKVKPDLDKISAELDIASKNSDKYLRADEKLKNLKTSRGALVDNITETEMDLKELRAKLIKAELELIDRRKELEDHDEKISTGEQYLKDNKNLKSEYDKVKESYDNVAKDSIAYSKWLEIKKKSKERDEFETLAQGFDNKAKALVQKRKEAQAEILPDIKGVELYTEDTHEDGVMKKEGLYVDKKNTKQLSETEWYAFVMQIWKKFKVRIIVVDNMQSLGSKGVEMLEKLSADGAYILAAEMNRGQKELIIEY